VTDVKYYRDLLAQRQRIEAFRRAIVAVVRPGDRVLDLGTGLGTFAFFAADAGAEIVWAVDGDPIVHVAKAIGRLNEYEGRVQFLRGWLPELELPAPADVIIFEDFPSRLLSRDTHRLLHDVLGRYAAPEVRAVPARAEYHLAPVSSPVLWSEVDAFDAERAYGLDWTPSRSYVANTPLRATISSDALVSHPTRIGAMRFTEPPPPDAGGGEARWRLARAAVIHGLAYWFDLDLGGGERLSNAPGAQPGSWGHHFLPADPPLELSAGVDLRAVVRTGRLADGSPSWLSWELEAGGQRRRGHEFAAAPASLDDLAAASPDGIPTLDRRGAVEAKVLALTDGRRSLREIAGEIAAEGTGVSQAEAERIVARALRGRIRVDVGLATVARGGS
jgi:protein arginine N-methyltransferase 1